MKIRKGSNRIAVIVGTVVFKFPRFNDLFFHSRKALASLLKEDKKSARGDFHKGVGSFLKGVMANLSEYACWITYQSPYLAPVYISVGVLSIQKYIAGEKPTNEELSVYWKLLPDEARKQMLLLDRRAYESHNFRKNEQGMWLINYGDECGKSTWPITNFLTRWRAELTQAFRPNQTPSD